MENFLAATDAHGIHGGHAVAVPGEVKGLWEIHMLYGHLGWSDLLAPSVKMAREGMVMGRDLYDFLARECPSAPSVQGTFLADEPFASTFVRGGKLIATGETWYRPDYACVLETVGRDGPDAFYEGPVAAAIVKAVRSKGGVMSTVDLRNYAPIHRAPLSATFRGHRVYSTPAPASGAALLSALATLDSFPLTQPGSAQDEHVTLEAMRLAYGARVELGDPRFVDVDGLQDDMVRGYDGRVGAKTRAPDYYLPGVVGQDDNGTSSMAAVDASGLVISLTTTVGTLWASRIMVPGTGIVLNDSNLDFTVAGRPNVWGYAPAPSNFVAGSRRPLSSMCPYIITAPVEGQVEEVVALGGAAGGATIPSTNIVAVRNMLAYGLSAGDALAQPRAHNQVLPNVTVLERSSKRGRQVTELSEEAVKGLQERGHVIEWLDKSFSTPCAMRVTSSKDGYEAAGDARKYDAGGAVCVGGEVLVHAHPVA